MRSLLLFVFGITLVCCDERFIAGQYQGSNPIAQGEADFLKHENSNQNQGTHEPFERSPISGHNGYNGDYKLSSASQMSGGRFAWISGGGNSVSVSDGAQVWYNLGLDNGYFATTTLTNAVTFRNPGGATWKTVVAGSLSSVAASGDYVAVCGTFNSFGDLEYGTLTTVSSEVNDVDKQNIISSTSVAIFHLPSGNTEAFRNSWKAVWPTGYSSSNVPQPLARGVQCSTLTGFGTQGNFLINEQTGLTWQIKSDGSIAQFAGNRDSGGAVHAYTFNPNVRSFKIKGENAYAAARNLEGVSNPNQNNIWRIARRGSGEAGWTTMIDLSTATSQAHRTGLQINGLGSKLTDFEPDCDQNLYTKFATGTYNDISSNPIGEGHSDHYGEYIWKLPSGKSAEADYEIISNDRFVSGLNSNGANANFYKTASTAFNINWNPATGKLLVSSNTYTLQSKSANPEEKYNTPSLIYPWHVDPQQIYERDEFICKNIKQLGAYNDTTKRFDIAFGGGLRVYNSPSSYVWSLCGESQTYFLKRSSSSADQVGYNWYTPHISHYDDDTEQWQKFQTLGEGVGQDCNGPESSVNFVQEYNDGYIVAGQFRGVGFEERFSLFWISKDGQTTKSYPVRSTLTSGGSFVKNRWRGYKVPGLIRTAYLKDDWLFVAGTFDWVEAPNTEGMSVLNIAVLNLKDEKWYSMQGGTVGTVQTLMWNDGRLFIGGSFTKMGEILTSNVATFKPESGDNYTCCFESINHGVDGTVYEFALSSEWGDGIFAFGASNNVDPSGSVSDGYKVAKYNGKYFEALDQHWRRPCDETKSCKPSSGVMKPYVMNKKAYFPDPNGYLYEFDGARFRKIADFSSNSGSTRLLGNMGNGNLIYWSGQVNGADNSELSYTNVEWDQKKQNMVPSKAGIDLMQGKRYWTTRTDSKIEAGAAVSLGPILSLIFVSALLILL